MYINRHLENQVLEATNNYPVVMLCGQRQVGKSTIMYHLKENNISAIQVQKTLANPIYFIYTPRLSAGDIADFGFMGL